MVIIGGRPVNNLNQNESQKGCPFVANHQLETSLSQLSRRDVRGDRLQDRDRARRQSKRVVCCLNARASNKPERYRRSVSPMYFFHIKFRRKLEDFRTDHGEKVKPHLAKTRLEFFRERRCFKLNQLGDLIKRQHAQTVAAQRQEMSSPNLNR